MIQKFEFAFNNQLVISDVESVVITLPKKKTFHFSSHFPQRLSLLFGQQASTVNMNVMGPLYNAIKRGIHSDRTLGISLFIGK